MEVNVIGQVSDQVGLVSSGVSAGAGTLVAGGVPTPASGLAGVGNAVGIGGVEGAGRVARRVESDGVVLGRVGIGGGEVLRLIEDEARLERLVQVTRSQDSPAKMDGDLRSQVERAVSDRRAREEAAAAAQEARQQQREQAAEQADRARADAARESRREAERAVLTKSDADAPADQRSGAVLVAAENASASFLGARFVDAADDTGDLRASGGPASASAASEAEAKAVVGALAAGPYEPDRMVDLLG